METDRAEPFCSYAHSTRAKPVMELPKPDML